MKESIFIYLSLTKGYIFILCYYWSSTPLLYLFIYFVLCLNLKRFIYLTHNNAIIIIVATKQMLIKQKTLLLLLIVSYHFIDRYHFKGKHTKNEKLKKAIFIFALRVLTLKFSY